MRSADDAYTLLACNVAAADDDGDDDDDDGDGNDDDDGLPAYSHHDKITPWWGNVSNDKGRNVSVSNSHHSL